MHYYNFYKRKIGHTLYVINVLLLLGMSGVAKSKKDQMENEISKKDILLKVIGEQKEKCRNYLRDEERLQWYVKGSNLIV